jgi:RNA polymerase sigma-70 factor (ECF subfamily)
MGEMAASVLQSGVLSGLSRVESPSGISAAESSAPLPLERGTAQADVATAGATNLAPASVAEVYETYANYVFRCLRSLGVRAAHVEDAVQDVFVVVHDKLASFDGKAKLSTWLYAIVLRIARKYRARQASESHGEPPEQPDWQHGEANFLSREQLRLAHAALGALTDDKREVFVLAEIEQMSAPEIAAITFTPLNTVYSRLRAARFEFERRLEQLSQRADKPFGRSR